MSCSSPLDLFTISSHGVKFRIPYKVPCGRCCNCITTKVAQLSFLSSRELQTMEFSGRSSTFVTLTYDDFNVPRTSQGFMTLNKKHFKDFMKRFRINLERAGIHYKFKYIYCGEYGDGSHSNRNNGVSTFRPHMHLALFGLSDKIVSKFIAKSWTYGFSDVGPLSLGGINYICSYVSNFTVPEVKQLLECLDVQKPFFYHSIGLGKSWILENEDLILKNNFTFNRNGESFLYPKYIIRYLCNKHLISTTSVYNKYFNNLKQKFKNIKTKEQLFDYLQDLQVIRNKQKLGKQLVNGGDFTNLDKEYFFIRPKSHRISPYHKKLISQYVQEALS